MGRRDARGGARPAIVTIAYPDPELGDDRIRLRLWDERDLELVREASADPAIRRGTTVPDVYTDADGRAFIERQRRRVVDGQGIALAVARAGDNRAVGHVYLGVRPQPRVIGLGYWVAPPARGRGIATRAARLATEWALGAGGAARVEAWVAPANAASLAVLAAAGFTREGVLRSFLDDDEGDPADMVVLSRILCDR